MDQNGSKGSKWIKMDLWALWAYFQSCFSKIIDVGNVVFDEGFPSKFYKVKFLCQTLISGSFNHGVHFIQFIQIIGFFSTTKCGDRTTIIENNRDLKLTIFTMYVHWYLRWCFCAYGTVNGLLYNT